MFRARESPSDVSSFVAFRSSPCMSSAKAKSQPVSPPPLTVQILHQRAVDRAGRSIGHRFAGRRSLFRNPENAAMASNRFARTEDRPQSTGSDSYAPARLDDAARRSPGVDLASPTAGSTGENLAHRRSALCPEWMTSQAPVTRDKLVFRRQPARRRWDRRARHGGPEDMSPAESPHPERSPRRRT